VRNILLIIEYDGTHFCGWQIQPQVRTVQGEIEKVLYRFTGKKIALNGAGRTDARVHAQGQAANFYLESSIPVERIPLALNPMLPEDISVKGALEKPMAFHARFDALGKRYAYQIYRGTTRNALLRNYSYHVTAKLDLRAMEKAAGVLVGTHDFKGFMAAGSPVKDTIRTLYTIEITEVGECLWLTFEGNGFLYNMVRILVGTLLEVGKGKMALDQVRSALTEEKSRVLAGPTVPPQGLFMKEVFYSNP